MSLPADLKYTKEHEWTRIEGNIATIGVTDFAQSELGDIAWLEMPEVGDETKIGETFGTIEAVKTVEDLYAPISGKIIEINSELLDSPELVNDDPYGRGWIVKLEISNEAEIAKLLSADDYAGLIE
ncbi:glycine cleavage system protein GcvH [Candidatus Marinimicrobia bacterium MT.SAG.3]|nr:glycine cleavage system protein GcvH [Candidatus Marinimicrobia bacterium MT.SAG.3]